MSVQAAVSSARDFFQANVSVKQDGSEQGADSPANGFNSDFKNMLANMRGQKNCAANQKAAGSVAKGFANGVVMINELPDSEELLPDVLAEGVDAEFTERPVSRFDPDAILGDAILGVVEEKTAKETGGEPLEEMKIAEGGAPEDAESAERPDAVKPPQLPAQATETPVAPQEAIAAEQPVTDSKIADCGENDKDQSLVGAKNALSRTQPKKPAKTARPDTDTNTLKNSAFGEALDKASADVSSEGEASAGLREDGGAQGTVDESDTKISDIKASETKSYAAEQRVTAQNSKGSSEGAHVSRADGEAVQHSQRNADGVSSSSGVAEHGRVSPFARFADAARAAEQPAAVRMPVTYPLAAGDKFGDGLLSVVEFMTKGESPEVRIVVAPPELGRVDVSLKASSDGLEAMFRVDSEELRRMVQNQIDSLKTSLQAQGIHVSGLTVDIRNGDGNGRGEPANSKGGKKGRRGGDNEAEQAEEARIVRLDLERGLLHWVA